MCRYGTHRADSSPDESRTTDTPRPTDAQRREWRRWIVETFTGDYGVVPVDHLVARIVDREPEAIDQSAVRAALTETVLLQLDRESVLEYDADHDVLINYNNRS